MHENYLNCIEGNVRVWNIKEEDLYKFRMTCKDRLSPEGAMVFFIGGIVYTSVFMFFIFMGAWSIIILSLTKQLLKLKLFLYSLQFIF